MHFATFVTSPADLERCVQRPEVSEVLLEPAVLAREGWLSEERVYELARLARSYGLRTVLVWDILMPEWVMQTLTPRLREWDWSLFDAVRVNDVGAAQWVRLHLPAKLLQWNVEAGNHNQDALLNWCEMLGPSLERLILSIELPEEKLQELCRILPVTCEIMGVGRILLFYSPRLLLLKHIASEAKDFPRREAVSASENANFKPLPVLETMHGTFLFLDKDQFILDRLDGLAEAGLHTVRLDLRHLSDEGEAATSLLDVLEQLATDPAALRKSWPRPTRAPFFRANNTTGQFSRLKARVHAHRDVQSLAEVLASEKHGYMVIRALRSFGAADASCLMVPSGDEVRLWEPLTLQTLEGDAVEAADSEQILVTNWVKHACSGALLRCQPARSQV